MKYIFIIMLLVCATSFAENMKLGYFDPNNDEPNYTVEVNGPVVCHIEYRHMGKWNRWCPFNALAGSVEIKEEGDLQLPYADCYVPIIVCVPKTRTE